MAEKKIALIIANSQYEDPILRQLVAPAQDAEALAEVLRDPAISGFEVQTLLNEPRYRVEEEIEAFFLDRDRDDLLLLYFSGHGVTDDDGLLYYAARNTHHKRLRSTAVAANFVNDSMSKCRSRRQVLLLDCCHSGAFARTKAAPSVNAGQQFGGRTPEEGRGRFVLTASDAFQYSFEGDAVEGQPVYSVFTQALVQGLRTGEADRDGDGFITLDELYEYVYRRVTDQTPQQSPRKSAYDVDLGLVIARNSRPVEALLPDDIRLAIDNFVPEAREVGIRRLESLLRGKHRGFALAAHKALLSLVEDDSRRVASAAERCLAACAEQIRALEEPLRANATAAPDIAPSKPIAPIEHPTGRVRLQPEDSERLAAAEKARREQEERERQAAAAAEQARVEKEERERQAAAEKARLKREERKRQAAEKARLEQEEREKLEAAERARVEREKRKRQAAARKARLEQEEEPLQAAIVPPDVKPRRAQAPSFPPFVPTASGVVVSQRRLCQLDYTNWFADTLTVSPDNRRLAYMQKVSSGFLGLGTKYAAIVDGVKGPPYDNFMKGRLVFSPDSRRLAHGVVREEQGDKWMMSVDGQEGRIYDGLSASGVVFSPDSQRFAYGARKKDKWVVVVDGREGQSYDGLASSDITFSPDSRHLAYSACRNDKWMVVVDGQEGHLYDALLAAPIIFSPDSQRLAYGARSNDEWMVVVDGKEGQRYDGIAASGIRFSPDSRRVAYGAIGKGKWMVVLDGREGRSHDSLSTSGIVFSPDSRRVAYEAVREGKSDKWMVVVDGQEGPPYDGLLKSDIVFSPDSQRLAYGAKKNDKWMVVVDGREGKPYDALSAGGIILSPDSRHFAYGVHNNDKWIVVVDGQEAKAYDSITEDYVFSPDSRHLAYIARPASSWAIVVDGIENTAYGGIVKGGRIIFDTPDSFHLLAVREGEVVLVSGDIR